jgi:hypothetical protein
MKELQTGEKLSEKQGLEIVENKKQEVELKWIDNLRPLKGHTLWEINKETFSVSKAEFITVDTANFLEFERSKVIRSDKKLIMKPNHAYISALTKEKAIERYKSGKGSAFIPPADVFYLNCIIQYNNPCICLTF